MSIKGIIISGVAFLCLAAALTLFPGGAQGKSGSGHITATLEPSQILQGGSAVLSVSLSGAQTGQPNIPRVNGLRLIPAGQSSQYQSLNGRVSSSVSYLYRVEADQSGDFTIPPVEAMVNGGIKSTQPLSLRVLKTLPPPSSGSSRNVAPLSGEEADRIVFLRVIPAKDRLYVGEMAPVEIKAFFREGLQATLNTLPRIDGDAFAWQSSNKEPQQTREVIDGRVFHVLTWYTAISGVKEGEYPLSVQLDATVLVPDTSSRIHSPFGRSLFDDDFFNSFFTRHQQRQIKTEAPPQKMRVLPLPQLGRPEDFNGAVGRFELDATASPKRSMVGDPIKLNITVKGSGNFDRVSCPTLSSEKGWKTYTPSAAFKPSDSPGCSGKKAFEQAVIPLEASIQEIPPVVFSYFDTSAEKYVSLQTKPIPVEIADAASGNPKAAHPSSLQSVKGSDSGRVDTSPTGGQPQGLAPIHVTQGPGVDSLRPTLENPWFLGAQGIPLGALFTGLLFSRRRRRMGDDPELARRKQVRQQIQRSIKEMDQAIAGHDVEGFFRACRCATQERLGEIWVMPPESITLADVRERLPDTAAGIKNVFETADAAAYSGQTFGQEELRRCKELVITELKNLGGKR